MALKLKDVNENKIKSEYKHLLNNLKNNDNSIQEHHIKGVKLTDRKCIICEIGYYLDIKTNSKSYFCHNFVIQTESVYCPLSVTTCSTNSLDCLFYQLYTSLYDLVNFYNELNPENQIIDYVSPTHIYAFLPDIPEINKTIDIIDEYVEDSFIWDTNRSNFLKNFNKDKFSIDLNSLINSELYTIESLNIETRTKYILIRLDLF